MANSTSSSSELWQAFVGTALMGTDRQKPNPPQAKANQDALATVVGQLDWQQPEQALLGAAGAIALHRQVGQLPQSQALPKLESCEQDEMPCCRDLTARHLNQILENQTELLPELLGLMSAAGQRAPEMLLPKLLRYGQKSVAIRPAILAVLGKRGRWLAAQNPAWHYGQGLSITDFTTETPELKALWPEESAQSRALKLAAWREVDASAAREALEAVWSVELAKEREALLGALETNLSLADEDFLEQVLEEKGKAVKRVAIDLLAQLSGSGFCDRMTQRATALVQVEEFSEGIEIQVNLPETYDKAWKRDGVERKAPKGEGQRAWWLRQIIAYTPLGIWQWEPKVIAEALNRHEWQDTLLLGWGLAVQRQDNADWAKVLLERFGLRQFQNLQFVELLSLLSAEVQEDFWKDYWNSVKPENNELQFRLRKITQTKLPLSPEFSRLVIQQLEFHFQSKHKHRYQLAYDIQDLAQMLHPEITSELAELLKHLLCELQGTYGQDALQNMLGCLSFRREIHQAFDASG